MRLSKIIYLIVVLLLPEVVQGQQHYNAWMRTTLSVPVAAKWRADMEVQHRRQNGYGDKGMLANELMYTVRPWLHGQVHKDMRVSVSPLAWFSNYRIVQHAGDEHVKQGEEWRSTVAAELQRQPIERLQVYNRLGLEYRNFTNGQGDVLRMRDRVGVRYNVNQLLTVGGYEELLLNVAGVPVAHLFDHNRLAAEVELKASGMLRVNAGYMRALRLPLVANNLMSEHNVFVNVTVVLHKAELKKDAGKQTPGEDVTGTGTTRG